MRFHDRPDHCGASLRLRVDEAIRRGDCRHRITEGARWSVAAPDIEDHAADSFGDRDLRADTVGKEAVDGAAFERVSGGSPEIECPAFARLPAR